VIELSNIGFSYDERPLLEHVSLAVRAGEVVGIVGPNGSGKSTLLHIALGLMAPRTGSVAIGGVIATSLSPRARARLIAAMLQDEVAGFPMSVKDCVLLGRTAHLPAHGFEAESDLLAAERAMAEAGVLALAERTIGTLSGGERRRVLLARALAQQAPALILDEPAANLDIAHQLELFERLRACAAAGSAVLVSVHDLNLAARACDRVLLLEAPSVHVVGPPTSVLTVDRIQRAFSVEVEQARSSDDRPYFVALRPMGR
jgi:iron complex transport system ATP-binding protein